METQLSIVSGLPPRTLSISQTSVIGRAAEADLVLVHPEISRRHCRLVREGDNWFVEDLGSTNGTFIGSNRLTEPVRLEAGVPVRVGRTVLELRR